MTLLTVILPITLNGLLTAELTFGIWFLLTMIRRGIVNVSSRDIRSIMKKSLFGFSFAIVSLILYFTGICTVHSAVNAMNSSLLLSGMWMILVSNVIAVIGLLYGAFVLWSIAKLRRQ